MKRVLQGLVLVVGLGLMVPNVMAQGNGSPSDDQVEIKMPNLTELVAKFNYEETVTSLRSPGDRGERGYRYHRCLLVGR